MKLASYIIDGHRSFGVVGDEGVFDVPTAWPDGPGSLRAALECEAMGRIRERATTGKPTLSLDEVTLLPPVPDAPKVFGLAVNYAEHHNEFDRGAPLPDDPRRRTTPRPFLMPPTVLIGPGEVIPYPATSRQVDYEVELAVVIGRRCKAIAPDEAPGVIAGYTIANDVSARSATFAEGREERYKDDFFDWLHGKWCDGFCPTGPWLATPEEIGDPQDLAIRCRVNGELRQDANTRCMIFPVVELVSFISHLVTLTPGDLIATGTPSGVGMAEGRLLSEGDEIVCEIERIGRLVNRLGAEPDAFYRPCSP